MSNTIYQWMRQIKDGQVQAFIAYIGRQTNKIDADEYMDRERKTKIRK